MSELSSTGSEQFDPRQELIVFADGIGVLQLTGAPEAQFDWTKHAYGRQHKGMEALIRTSDDQLHVVVDPWGRTIVASDVDTRKAKYLVAAVLNMTETDQVSLPIVTFGRPWMVPGLRVTTGVQEILLGYKPVDTKNIPVVKRENPITASRRILQRVRIAEVIAGLPVPYPDLAISVHENNSWLINPLASE